MLFADGDRPIKPQTAQFFVDESGSKGSGGRFFVVSAIKTRNPGALIRQVDALRDAYRFRSEFKYSGINAGSVAFYREVIRVLASSDAHLSAYVVDKNVNTEAVAGASWDAHIRDVTRLIVGSTNKNELTSVALDIISFPKNVAVDDAIKLEVNKKLGSLSVVSCLCLDSRTTTGLQLADLVAGAIAFDRKQPITGTPPPASPKAQVARHLAERFNLADFRDQRTQRVNILTARPSRGAKTA